MPKRTPRRNTRTIILSSALKLFNRDGVVNVRLQHIADEAFVSVGNLAYHFPNKDALVVEIYQSFARLQKQQLAELGIVPLFEYLDQQFRQTFQLQRQYIFFFLDTLEIIRAYPEIATAHQQHIDWTVQQLELVIDFNISRGVFQFELAKLQQKKIAEQVWMTIDGWLAHQHIRGAAPVKENEFVQAIWSLFLPYLTPLGRQEFTQMQQLSSS